MLLEIYSKAYLLFLPFLRHGLLLYRGLMLCVTWCTVTQSCCTMSSWLSSFSVASSWHVSTLLP